MEQLTATVKLNAENAREASQLADTATETAGKGARWFQKWFETMDGIAASSKQIAEITSVINSIAFQTNILALNAAVEAAGAGEQGAVLPSLPVKYATCQSQRRSGERD